MAGLSPAVMPDRNFLRDIARGSHARSASAGGASIVSVRACDRRGPDGHLQHVQAYQRGAPQRAWEEQPNPEWRAQIAAEETRRSDGDFGYGMRGQSGSTALGRYQMLRDPLADAGWRDRLTGNWTARARAAGVASDSDFLASPAAQGAALSDVMRRNEEQLRAFGATRFIGQEVPGLREDAVPVTEAGLAAAAHREGAKGVRDYREHQAANQPPPVSVPDQRGNLSRFIEIERRLRAFAQTPYQGLAR